MGWQRFGLHAVLVLSSVVMLTPMVWLIAATIKGPDDLFHYLFFPSPSRFSLYNFRQLFEQIPYVRFMINSLFVAGATVLVARPRSNISLWVDTRSCISQLWPSYPTNKWMWCGW